MTSHHVISGLEDTAGEESYFEDTNRDNLVSESDPESDEHDDDDENQKFSEMLIEAVGAKRLLYDKSMKDYKNADKINSAWRKVGEELKFPAEKCRERWQNLRSSYCRNKRNQKRPSGSKAKRKNSAYKFKAQMSFIDHFIKPKKTQSNFGASPASTVSTESPSVNSLTPGISGTVDNGTLTLLFENPPSDAHSVGSFNPTSTGDQFNTSGPSTGGNVPETSAPARKRPKQDPIDDAILQYFNDKREQMKGGAQKHDDCDYFGLLVADELRKLDSIKRRKLRSQLMKVIDDFVLENVDGPAS